jgi:hypothetical protein
MRTSQKQRALTWCIERFRFVVACAFRIDQVQFALPVPLQLAAGNPSTEAAAGLAAPAPSKREQLTKTACVRIVECATSLEALLLQEHAGDAPDPQVTERCGVLLFVLTFV